MFEVSSMDFRLIRHLWYFLAVAEERHFGRAAKRLGISQPPLSQQIQVLERVLGVRLFDRSRSGVRLTPEAEAILPAVQRLSDQARRLEVSVLEAKEGRARSLLVGAINSAMFHPLAVILRELRLRMPEMHVSLLEMDSADALTALEREEIDVAFVRADTVSAPLRAEPLATERLVVAIPVEHAMATRLSLSLTELATEPMVMCPRRVSPVYVDCITSACRAAGFSPRVVHEVASVVSQVAFVSCGAGLALVPSNMTRLNTAGVVFRPLKESIDVVTTAVVWNTGRDRAVIPDVVKLAREIADTTL